MARILPLQPDAISQLQSSKQIASLQGVVLALLENSLDAGSTKVEIYVDQARGGCTIEDDGNGIPSNEFLPEGGLGKLYHTSKHAISTDHARRGSSGCFLASLAALSYLSITSRRADEEASATLILHNGKTLAREIPSNAAHDLTHCRDHGTCVGVRDLFGNMPVRVKQRALASANISGSDRLWQELERGVVALLLAWSNPSRVRLHDVQMRPKTVQLTAHHPSVSNALTERSLNRLGRTATKFDIRDRLPYLVQAGLVPADVSHRWVPASVIAAQVTIKGVINAVPAPTRHCQFISIGVRPCNSASGTNVLYDSINKIFANSSFGCVDDEEDLDEHEKDRRKHDRRHKQDGYTQKQLLGRKGVDRWPMFVLQVQLNGRHLSRGDVSESSLKVITDVLDALATQWLEAHHFRPRKSRRRQKEGQESPATSSPKPTPVILRTAPEGSASITPTFKRGEVAQNAATSKKRKFTDMSGNIITLDHDRPATVHGAPSEFHSWSRIKSGRSILLETKPMTADTVVKAISTNAMLNKPDNELKPARIRLAPLEAAALNKTCTVLTAPRNVDSSAGIPERKADDSHVISSEDFGSLDYDHVQAACTESKFGDNHDHHSAQAAGQQTADVEPVSGDDLVTWRDPVTKQVFLVNSRTGVVLPSRTKSATSALNVETPRRSAAINTTLSAAEKPLSLMRRPSTAKADGEAEWLPGFLKDWNNPVFVQQTEESIPITSINGPGVETTDVVHNRYTHNSLDHAFRETGTQGPSQLSKSQLSGANVVRQVDQKFILCKMDDTLVLVDQHAASERVILERLLAEFCSLEKVAESGGIPRVRTQPLEKRLRFQVSAEEHELLRRRSSYLASWGVLYDLKRRQADMTASQVRRPAPEHLVVVTSLPTGIAERCSMFPKLLIDILRHEAWNDAHMTSAQFRANKNAGDEEDWLKHIDYCPKGILEMLNSRACRSAIMFNDELSLTQCEELLKDLSKCVFPFMCAHGRVSMVPLLKIAKDDNDEGLFDDGPNNDPSFADACMQWKGVKD